MTAPTTRRSRLDLAGIETAGSASTALPSLPHEADNFGRDMSQTQLRDLNARGLSSLSSVWPALVEQMLRRAIQQAFTEALPSYWLRRAEQLEAVGTAWAEGAAVACRRHAWLLSQGLPEQVADELNDWFGEVA